jgi:precorrin-6B methylase 2
MTKGALYTAQLARLVSNALVMFLDDDAEFTLTDIVPSMKFIAIFIMGCAKLFSLLLEKLASLNKLKEVVVVVVKEEEEEEEVKAEEEELRLRQNPLAKQQMRRSRSPAYRRRSRR